MNINIDNIMKELASYNMMKEEIDATIEGLKDEIKNYMLVNNTDTVIGSEHKATYKPVESSRIDTTALKKALPEVAAAYTKISVSRRFTFN